MGLKDKLIGVFRKRKIDPVALAEELIAHVDKIKQSCEQIKQTDVYTLPEIQPHVDDILEIASLDDPTFDTFIVEHYTGLIKACNSYTDVFARVSGECKAKDKQISELNNDKGNLQVRISSLETEKKASDKNYAKEKQQLEKQYEKNKIALDNALKEKKAFESSLKEKTALETKLNKQVKQLEGQLSGRDVSRNKQLSDELNELRMKYGTLEEQRDQLRQQLEGQVVTAEPAVDNGGEVEGLRQENAALQSKLQHVEPVGEEGPTQAAYDALMQEKLTAETEVTRLNGELTTKTGEYQTLNTEKAAADNQITELEQLLAAAQQAAQQGQQSIVDGNPDFKNQLNELLNDVAHQDYDLNDVAQQDYVLNDVLFDESVELACASLRGNLNEDNNPRKDSQVILGLTDVLNQHNTRYVECYNRLQQAVIGGVDPQEIIRLEAEKTALEQQVQQLIVQLRNVSTATPVGENTESTQIVRVSSRTPLRTKLKRTFDRVKPGDKYKHLIKLGEQFERAPLEDLADIKVEMENILFPSNRGYMGVLRHFAQRAIAADHASAVGAKHRYQELVYSLLRAGSISGQINRGVLCPYGEEFSGLSDNEHYENVFLRFCNLF